MSYFPEIKDDRSSDSNLSPLNEIIQELKRKNVVASAASGGPQLALDSRSDPWGSSEAALGMAEDGITISFGRRERSFTTHSLPQTPSSTPFEDNDSAKAATELASLLWICSHEMSLEDYGRVESKTFTRVFALVHSKDNMDRRMAGLAALDALIDAPSADEERKAIKFANTLSGGLRSARGNYEFLSAVSKALGHMASRTANIDFVESEVTRALEWLRTDRSDRRLAATLALKEFAIHAPTAFYSKTSQSPLGQGGSNEFLDYIFQAVRDPQPIVRACAADALSQCLKILMERQHMSLTGLLCQVHFSIMEGLDMQLPKNSWANPAVTSKVETSQHGSLLVAATMIAHTRDFMLPRYDEVCNKVIEFMDHPKVLIRLELVRLLPRLAQRCPRIFARRYLDQSLEFLLATATSSPTPRVGVDIRPVAFHSIGRMVLALVDPITAICRRLDEIFELVSKGLKCRSNASSRKTSVIHEAAFHCAADLIKALGEMAHPYISGLVNDMFGAGLSNDLIQCLHAIAECVPEQQSVIEDRLFQEVSICLADGKEDPTIRINMSSSPAVVKSIVLSLQTLGTFGDCMGRVTTFDSVVPILPFVQNVAAPYLSHPSSEVRRAAALTCCVLLVPPGNMHRKRVGSQSAVIIEHVLDLLLQVAVSDLSPVVRLCVVRALDSRYDPFLCQIDTIQNLLLLLQDEVLATRAAGVSLLGRLASINPAPILPAMRKFLMEVIVELQCGLDTGRGREEATRLLVVFLRSNSLRRLIHPVLPAMIENLPLNGKTPRLASAAMEALGELAKTAGAALQPWVDEVVPNILDTLQDQSSASKQRASLRTLAQIAGSTGYVIQPYIDYPKLLSQATDILPGTKRAPWSLRREVIRTLGVLGALDPDLYNIVAPQARKGKKVVLNLAESFKKLNDSDDDIPVHLSMYEQYAMVAQPVSSHTSARRMTPADDEFYPTVTIQALMRVFKNSSLAVHHGMVMQAIMFIFKSLGLGCTSFLNQVVPHVLLTIRNCGPTNLRESLLKQVATLSGIVREHLRPYVADIFDIVENFWTSRHISTIFSLISHIAVGGPDEFKLFVPRLIRLYLKSLDEIQIAEWVSTDLPVRHRRDFQETERLRLILCSIRSLKGVLGDYLHVLVPALLKLADALLPLISDNLINDYDSVTNQDVEKLSVLLFQTTSALLECEGTSNSNKAMLPYWGEKNAYSGNLSARIVQPLIRILRDKCKSNRSVGLAVVHTIFVCTRQLANKSKINQSQLQRAWDVSQCASRDDWDEWMRRLGIQLLREAPSPALRASASLAHAYQPLSRELFSAAFVCCWKELNQTYKINLVHALETAFVADISPEILQALLNLAEFMEHDPHGGLPIDISILANLALKCRAYAKALHYKEREHSINNSNSCVEALISINRKLDLQEAALGVLKSATMRFEEQQLHDDMSIGTFTSTGLPRQHNPHEMFYSVALTTDDKQNDNMNSLDLAENRERWLAKLGSWTDALKVYKEKLMINPKDFDAALGCMRCLSSSGEWTQVLKLAEENWSIFSLGSMFQNEAQDNSNASHSTQVALREQRKALKMCAKAAWRLGRWDDLEKYSSELVDGKRSHSVQLDFDGAFFSAILHIHREEWQMAAESIDGARKAMDGRFTALMAESYNRAYPSIVTAQTLAEMEEIIEYRKIEKDSQGGSHCHPANRPNINEARERLLSVWRDRLAGCRVDAEVHYSIMAVRSLILGPEDEVEATLTLSDLSRQAQRFKLAERILLAPLEKLDNLTIQHKLYFAYLKHLWLTDRRVEARHRLSKLCDAVDLTFHCESMTDQSLRSACWLELGEWKLEETTAPNSNIADTLQVEVLSDFKRATLMNKGYKAWHNWALLNFRIAEQLNETDEGNGNRRKNISTSSSSSQRNHVIAAIKSFVNAIRIGTKRWSASVQQDMLNFLTCLFQYGEQREVAFIINECVGSVPIETWLGVLPQLLARIHLNNPSIRSVLHPLLVRLGEKHPQALMYPLSVLLKSPVAERKNSAESLMDSLRSHSSALVEEALMVSSELIRVAILWLETWHEGLEEASRLYFGEGNVSGMLDLLLPLHEKIEKGADTRREGEFINTFGSDLAQAHQHIKDYVRLVSEGGDSIPTGPNPSNAYDASGRHIRQNEEAETAMNKAWDIYYTVFRRINKQLPALTKLELSDCSPALSSAQSLELGVPGSYRVDGSYIKIEKFIPSVQVITSKQRPRKTTLRGSDGKDYVFLLKGHEDLRQDERVMQLFGLVNALLERDRQTKKHDLRIQRYAISPLSHNCGLVGWVPHTDTLHSLIRDYRQMKKIPLNLEHKEMLRIAPDYDQLTVMQKVEVFTDALKKTTGKGNDLYEILWLKSTNSEEWLERRTRYTRSLAVMSMVGYILGLGDRHPSNLMLDKLSGRVLHIDFGDCFEVAMNRDKYPEKVPFRLTRMLIKAMEVSGIEGSYRSTCERTMTVLRENRESLVAMLQAFLYDPLIGWRLVDLSNHNEGTDPANTCAEDDGLTESFVAINGNNMLNVDTGVPIDVGSRPGVVPITEGDEDEDEEGKDDLALPNVLNGQIIPSLPVARDREFPMTATRARSLQMYSNIQTWAANVGADERIESVTGGDATHGQIAASGTHSIARSRMVERSMRQRELLSILDGDEGLAAEEALNEKALKIIRRIQDKLNGTDFEDRAESGDSLDVVDQVQRLTVQATSVENLSQLFIGWCAFW
eukprot:jgi/Psemu1/318014/estExt_fgenesh1_pm.C_410004